MRSGMALLGYSGEWLELGVISEELLARQVAAWSKPEADPSPEHYRYGAWRAYLAQLRELPLSLLERLLALDLREAGMAGTPARSFGHAIAYDLAQHPALTQEGLELLRRHPIRTASFGRALDKAQARLDTTK